MKTPVAAFAACMALAVSAAPEKLLEVQFADKDALAAAAAQLADFAGNQALAPMCVMGLSQAPDEFARCCGENALAVYADLEGKASAEEIFETAEPRYETAKALKKGRIARVAVTEAGVRAIVRALDEYSAKSCTSAADKKEMEAISGIVKSISNAGLAVSIGDKGLDIGLRVASVPGSALSKCGTQGFSAKGKNPLAFAGKGAVLATIKAANLGSGEVYGQLRKLIDFVEGKGVSLKFVELSKTATGSKMVLDVPALVDYVAGGGLEAACKSISNPMAAIEEFGNLFPAELVPDSPEETFSLSLKGVDSTVSPATKLQRTFPEALKMPCFEVSCFSYYSILKNVVQALAKHPVASSVQGAQALVASLPPDGDAAVVAAGWRKGDDMYFTLRSNPAEIKGISSLVTAAISLAGMHTMQQSQLIPDDDDDD